MAVIHISEEEAARDLPAVLAKVRAGEQVQIEGPNGSVELSVKPLPMESEFPVRYTQPRPIADILAELKRNCSNTRLDGGYAKHLEEVIEIGQQERWTDWDR